jgi:hypothetical protein
MRFVTPPTWVCHKARIPAVLLYIYSPSIDTGPAAKMPYIPGAATAKSIDWRRAGVALLATPSLDVTAVRRHRSRSAALRWRVVFCKSRLAGCHHMQ